MDSIGKMRSTTKTDRNRQVLLQDAIGLHENSLGRLSSHLLTDLSVLLAMLMSKLLIGGQLVFRFLICSK